MEFDDLTHTHASMVEGLSGSSGGDQAVWHRFYLKYGPAIRSFCLHVYHLQPADADEVTQQVLINLYRALKLSTFDPKRSLRRWLKSVTEHAIIDTLRARSRRVDLARGGSEHQELLEVLPQDEGVDRLADQMTDELYRDLYARAEPMVKAVVRTQYWQVFELLKSGRTGAEVAAQLGITSDAVYQANRRVKKAFRTAADELLKTMEVE